MKLVRPAIIQEAPIPTGAVFEYGDRPLVVVKVHGRRKASAVIVEELTDRHGLKGQFGLWSVDSVRRAMRRRARS